ncbi:MAG: S-methyl-5'-thioadenosine phosphorylase [Gammaproteobacteria bacterium]
MVNPETIVGIIGGSGVYEIDGLIDVKWKYVDSPFGQPSDALLHGKLNGQKLVFLPRHARGHKIPPSEINYRANIDALKRSGVTDILSVSAVGSLREDLEPGTFVIVDQFIDRTIAREKSFFGLGCVAHVSMARPVCSRLGNLILRAAENAKIKSVDRGTYLAMEGPQFSSFAESELYRSWGCDVIGMTNMPEAKLAREAEICYATVGMVTDYDCWHPDHEAVTVDQVIQILTDNAHNARRLVKEVSPMISTDHTGLDCKCKTALDFAVVTQEEARDLSMVSNLNVVAGRVLKR